MAVTQTKRDQIKRLYSDVDVDLRNATGTTLAAYTFVKVVGDYAPDQIPSVDAITSVNDNPVGFLLSAFPNNKNTSFPSSTVRAVSRGRIQVIGFNTLSAAILDPVYCSATGTVTLSPVGKQIGVVLDLNVNGIIYIDLSTYASTASSPWLKYVFNYADFSTAANTNSIALFTLAPKESIEQINTKHNTSFTGGSLTDYRISVGILGNEDKYSSPFNVFQSVSDINKQRSVVNYEESATLSTPVLLTANSYGDLLSAATSGSVEIQILKSALL